MREIASNDYRLCRVYFHFIHILSSFSSNKIEIRWRFNSRSLVSRKRFIMRPVQSRWGLKTHLIDDYCTRLCVCVCARAHFQFNEILMMTILRLLWIHDCDYSEIKRTISVRVHRKKNVIITRHFPYRSDAIMIFRFELNKIHIPGIALTSNRR